MSDFERIFGAGADIKSIIEGINACNYLEEKMSRRKSNKRSSTNKIPRDGDLNSAQTYLILKNLGERIEATDDHEIRITQIELSCIFYAAQLIYSTENKEDDCSRDSIEDQNPFGYEDEEIPF